MTSRKIAAMLLGLALAATLAAPAQAEEPDHIVTCWVEAFKPATGPIGQLRFVFGYGQITCAPTPPDASYAYIQLEKYTGGSYRPQGTPAVYTEETVYHQWYDSHYCPNPAGTGAWWRTKIKGTLTEDGVSDSGTDYSIAVWVRC